MPRVVHFEIHADDMERAKSFYEKVFGWKIERWEGPMEYYNITTGEKDEPGIDGGLMKREGKTPKIDTPTNTYVCTISVPDIDEYLKKVTENRGKIIMPKSPIPGIGWLAYCLDTESNRFGIMQSDMSAR